jgi:hypothetical protein
MTDAVVIKMSFAWSALVAAPRLTSLPLRSSSDTLALWWCPRHGGHHDERSRAQFLVAQVMCP